MFKLAEKHLEEAKKIIEKHRKKKRCDKCYDRGYIGTTPENLLVPCPKCVDNEAAVQGWKDYVATVPELKEHFAELFEEEEQDEEPK